MLETLGHCALTGKECIGQECKRWGPEAVTDCFYNSEATERTVKELEKELEKTLMIDTETLMKGG